MLFRSKTPDYPQQYNYLRQMANRINRYQALYEAMPRSNNAAAFPRHVFVRAANLHSNIHDRVGDR